ncbi:hypothetical protein [Rhizobium sp. 18055]|jgi:hypothetical protein|uniref:hypothetical protein n=1 Tax=Rhizobium sp. 18055 TaxID=2681403 RepID=UPI001356D595|nr:hypothetical protein [Rhizobium sp. 18055]
MSAMSERDEDGSGRNARSVDDMKELAALARLITYARCAAEDVELVGAMHWLELAIQAVNREILDSPNTEIAGPYLSATIASRKTH